MQFFLGTWQNVQQQKLRRKIDNLCEQNVQLQRYTVLMRHFKKHKIAKFPHTDISSGQARQGLEEKTLSKTTNNGDAALSR